MKQNQVVHILVQKLPPKFKITLLANLKDLKVQKSIAVHKFDI